MNPVKFLAFLLSLLLLKLTFQHGSTPNATTSSQKEDISDKCAFKVGIFLETFEFKEEILNDGFKQVD